MEPIAPSLLPTFIAFCGLFGGLLLLGWLLGWLGERSGSSIGRAAFNPEQIDGAVVSDERILNALDKGNKIEAIKVYRELTGLGLKESKDAIEYLMVHPEALSEKKKRAAYDTMDAGIRDMIQEGRIDEAIEVYQKFAGVDEYTAMDAVAEIEHELRQGESAEVGDIDDRVRRLVDEGKKIEAIKLYREMTGVGLKEAKDAVEAVARRE
jgi:ribosomal protein L7/L12